MAEREEHVQLLHVSRDVSVFGQKARDAAVSLYTITYACSLLPDAEELQFSVASSLFSLGGIALCLSDCLTSLFSFSSPRYNLWELKDVNKLIGSCQSIFNHIDTAVKVADDYVRPGSRLPKEKGVHRIGAFTQDDGYQAQFVLRDCLHAFSRLSITVRREVLRQHSEL